VGVKWFGAILVFVLAACASPQGAERERIDGGVIAPTADVWRPEPGTTWQWQITDPVDTSFDVAMYDVDLFDAPVEVIEELHADGRVVVCYFSAGTLEDWRPDIEAIPPSLVGDPLEDWPDEQWLDIRDIDGLSPVLTGRLDLAVDKGCDGVEPDNVNAYENPTGFDVSADDQLRFNRWLAGEAHARSLSIGLKNDLPQASDLVSDFDWMLVEQCIDYEECDGTAPFIEAGLAVFAAEYLPRTSQACADAAAWGLSVIFKDLDLTADLDTCN
jgi:hypothetical protein